MAENTPQLDGKELAELMKLINDADSVKLKMTVPMPTAGAPSDRCNSTRSRPRSGRSCSSTLPTSSSTGPGSWPGRDAQGTPDDSVVKLRPVVPSQLPEEAAVVDRLQRRGRRHARRLRVLRVSERHGSLPARSSRYCRARKADPQLFTKGSGRSTTNTPRRADARAPRGARADHRAQAEVAADHFRRRMVAELWLYPGRPAISSPPPSACLPRYSRLPPRHVRSWLPTM